MRDRSVGFTSKQEASAKLHLPGTVDLAGDTAESAIANRAIGVTESHPVGEIEALGPQLQLHAFANLEVFEYREVKVSDTVSAKTGIKAGSVAINLIARIAIGRCIKVRPLSLHHIMNTDVAPRVSGDIRALAAIRQIAAGQSNYDR